MVIVSSVLLGVELLVMLQLQLKVDEVEPEVVGEVVVVAVSDPVDENVMVLDAVPLTEEEADDELVDEDVAV